MDYRKYAQTSRTTEITDADGNEQYKVQYDKGDYAIELVWIVDPHSREYLKQPYNLDELPDGTQSMITHHMANFQPARAV